MKRVYECELGKKAEMMAVLEKDPYAEDSFARMGYKVKEGLSIGESGDKVYLYLSASSEFIKKADERLTGIASPTSDEIQKRISEKIRKEEEEAESGLGSIFG